MVPNDRQKHLLEVLNEKKQMSVNKLCETLYSSPATVRRDLALLEANGCLHRVRGGAVSNYGENVDPPIMLRMNRDVQQKVAIAKEASKLIKDGMTIFLDSSTTAACLCPEIGKHMGITVITNNIHAFIALLDYQNVKTIICGGEANSRAYTFSYSIPKMISNYFADLFFFSCAGVSIENEIADKEEKIVEVKKAMLKHSAQQILLCTSSKLGAISYCKLCELHVPKKVICDSTAKNIIKNYFLEEKVIIAK